MQYRHIFFLFLVITSTIESKYFILIGPPGCGKGTFSQYMIEKYQYIQICPGDIYRNEIQLQTELGKQIEQIVQNGDYVDEKITCTLIENYILSALKQNKFFIIDGFPRSVNSFNFLDNLLNQYNIKEETHYIFFSASDESLINRVLNRQICTKCFKVYNTQTALSADTIHCDNCNTPLSRRSADTKTVITKRLAYFHTHIEPLTDIAMQHGYQYYKINTETTILNLLELYDSIISL